MRDWSRDVLGDFWVKLGCFLSGYSYTLISGSSEASRKVVRKLTSAFLLISFIWFSVGYLLCTRYFVRGNELAGIAAGIAAVVLVINIERTIVLSTKVSALSGGLRFLLAIIVALIGATVIDQVIFESDVEKYKKDHMYEAISPRIQQNKEVIAQNLERLQESRAELVKQKLALDLDFKRNPLKKVLASSSRESGTEGRPGSQTYTYASVPNPSGERADRIQNGIDKIDESMLIEARRIDEIAKEKEIEYLEDRGFLQELEILIKVVTENPVALVVYIIWLLLLILIELFVLIIKTLDAGNDYDKLIAQQMRIKMERISRL